MPEHGSLYTLPSEYNTTHEHEIPNSRYRCGLRISINCKHEGDPPEKRHTRTKPPKPFVREPGPPRIYHASGRFPADAVYVGRGGTFNGKDFPPSPFGNYRKLDLHREIPSELWRHEVELKMKDTEFASKVEALRGKDLICHCSQKEIEAGHSHARTWLLLSNGGNTK